MRFIYCLVLIAFTLNACNNNKNDNTSKAIEQKSRSFIQPPNGYHSLNGKVGNASLMVNLHITAQGIRGSYTDDVTGHLVHLFTVNYQPEVDSIRLLASPYRPALNNEISDDSIIIVYQDQSFKGYLKMFNKTPEPLEWKFSDTNNALPLSQTTLKDSLVMKEGPSAYIDVDFLSPSDITNLNLQKKINRWLIDFVFPEWKGKEDEMSVAVEKYINQYLQEFNKNMLKLMEVSDEDHLLPIYQYQQQRVMNVLYNTNKVLVLSNYIFDYSGGAHPNHVTRIQCYDVQKQKPMLWNDVFNTSPATIAPIVEKHFRIIRGLKPEEDLKNILFENELLPNQNFYVTHKGIGFWYVPYEIAPYVYGDTEVFIPYDQLTPYLREEFLTLFD